MIPVHPSHRYRRRYYRRVATAMAVAASIHVAAFVLAPSYLPRPITVAPSPLRLVRLAAWAGSGSTTASAPEVPAGGVATAGPDAADRTPETVSASRVVTEPATAAVAPRAAPGVGPAASNPGSIPSVAGAVEGEDAAPPVFYRYDTAPRVIRRVEPDYPLEARARAEEGTVVVNANIDERGRVERAWVVAKSAPEALVSAVIDAVYQFEFIPGKERGVPVPCTVAIPFSFTLKRIP